MSPCAEGRWGDIPVDATTVYVDSTAVGGDGSAQNPFKTISNAVSGAPAGAIVAIAAGSYAENVIVGGKALRLWGVCPEKVEIVGSALSGSCPPAALCIKGASANGSEVHALALTGTSVGLAVSGATSVVADRVWVHDTGGWGVDGENALGATSLSITASLFEQTHEYGVFAMGVDVDVERSAIRTTLPRTSDAQGGVGLGVQLKCSQTTGGTVSCDKAAPARATVRGSLVETNRDTGVIVEGSQLTMEASVVRGTLPRASDQSGGEGVVIGVPCLPNPTTVGACDPTEPSHAVIRTSLVSDNANAGVRVSGSVADIETTVIRDQAIWSGIIETPPCFDPGDGSSTCTTTAPSQLTLSSSLVDHNAYVGLMIAASTATISDSVVRGTAPRPTDMAFGRGVGVQEGCSMQSDGTLVCDPNTLGTASITRSLIAANRGEGLHVVDSQATVESSVIADTEARASGDFGDGISTFSDLSAAAVSIKLTRIQRSARAGLSSFGGTASLQQVFIECAGFELQGEPFKMRAATLEDGGGVLCGCPAATKPCQVSQAQLTPPEPITEGP